jgi:hypothetical protein
MDSTSNTWAATDLGTGEGLPIGFTKHFAPWTGYFMVGYSPLQPDGPTPLPNLAEGGNIRETWTDGASGGVAYLNLTVTTEFDGWPCVNPSGYNFTEDPFAENMGNLTDGSFTYSYAVNQYTGAVTTTNPGTAPNTYQSALLFPQVPPTWWQFGDGVIHAGETTLSPGDGGYPWSATRPLVSWNFTATELQFVWGAWMSGYDIGQAASTITQTLALGAEYDVGASQSQALALLTGTTFAALNWNQKAACSYRADGSIAVVTSALSASGATDTTCSGSGSGGAMAGPTATAAGGFAATAASANGWNWSHAKALVDVCGQYCLRTFYCNRTPALVNCASGSVDGFAPVEIDPPAFNGLLGDQSVGTFLFTNCQCV